MITAVGKIIVPVDDQERAKEFWTKRVCFQVARDETYGDERWIELSAPGGGPVIVLSPRPDNQPLPKVTEMLSHSPVFFSCDDIEETYRGAQRPRRRVPRPASADALRLVVDAQRPGRNPLCPRTVDVRATAKTRRLNK